MTVNLCQIFKLEQDSVLLVGNEEVLEKVTEDVIKVEEVETEKQDKELIEDVKNFRRSKAVS